MIASAALVLGCFAPAAPAALLLSDNFTGTGTTSTANVNFNLAARQAGSLAPLTYTSVGNAQVGNVGTLRTAPQNGDYLLLAGNAHVSPDFNFNAASGQGGLDIRFSVAPDNDVNVTDWTAINLGASQADRQTGVADNLGHFGILFRANGRIEAFDGTTRVSPTPIEAAYGPSGLGGSNNNFYPVRLLVTDPIDGNPFDGVGQTKIDVFSSLIDGGNTSIFSYTKAGNGYADNWMNFQSNSIGGIDDLSITQVPEPASLAALGLLATAGLTARRRRRA